MRSSPLRTFRTPGLALWMLCVSAALTGCPDAATTGGRGDASSDAATDAYLVDGYVPTDAGFDASTDPCSPSPCVNGGTCSAQGAGYACACPAGYAGANCETNVDDCASNPCMNGGTCVDGIAGYSCQCAAGYTGTNCQTVISGCSTNPCLNGTCNGSGVNYTCTCAGGWTGADCDVAIDPCTPSNPCQNGGSCSMTGPGTFACGCTAGWSGTTCTTNLDDCASGPCQNGASCVDGLASYTCNCAMGWSGATCSTNIDECASMPCQNGGSCVDLVNAYSCSCPAGYSGTDCQTAVAGCASNPCVNATSCTNGAGGTYACACQSGWQGANCDTPVNACSPTNPCSNGGTCSSTGPGTYGCSCAPGFAGTNCQTNVDDCVGNPCANGGICADGVNGYSCACPSGYAGTTCQYDVRPGTYQRICDGSGAVPVDATHFLNVDDETQVVRIFTQGATGQAVQTFDIGSSIGVSNEADFEGAVRVGNRAFLIGSHGRDKNGVLAPERSRFVALDLAGTVPSLSATVAGYRTNLLSQMLVSSRWTTPDAAVITLLTQRASLGVNTDANLAPKVNGIAVEGLAQLPTATGTRLAIGFRNPLIGGDAIVVTLENPDAFATGSNPQFGSAIRLNLSGFGIRAMVYSPYHQSVFIISGTTGDGTDFRLWRWTGSASDAPVFVQSLAPPTAESSVEAFVVRAGSPVIRVLFDEGARLYSGTECKDRSASNQVFHDTAFVIDP